MLLESAAPVAFVVPIPTLVVVLIPVSFAENLPPATPVSAEPSPLIVPLIVALPATVKLLPTVKSPGASFTLDTLNALYATASMISPFITPPPDISKVEPLLAS